MYLISVHIDLVGSDGEGGGDGGGLDREKVWYRPKDNHERTTGSKQYVDWSIAERSVVDGGVSSCRMGGNL